MCTPVDLFLFLEPMDLSDLWEHRLWKICRAACIQVRADRLFIQEYTNKLLNVHFILQLVMQHCLKKYT